MIRHMVMFSFDEKLPAEIRGGLLVEMEDFPQRYKQIKNWEMGANVSERDDTFEYCATMTFDTVDDLKAYLNSEEHERFVRERFRPLVSKRAVVSFEVASIE